MTSTNFYRLYLRNSFMSWALLIKFSVVFYVLLKRKPKLFVQLWYKRTIVPKKLPSGNGTTLGASYIIHSASKMKKQMHHNSTEHNHKLTWIVHNWVRNKRREKKKNNDAGKQRSRIESSHGHRPRHSETPHSTFLSPLSSSSNLIPVLSLTIAWLISLNFN